VESLSITPQIAGQKDLRIDHGEYVVSDVDGAPINRSWSFADVFFSHAAGERVRRDVFRDGKTIKIVAVPDARPVSDP